jgi:hypothetical protein
LIPAIRQLKVTPTSATSPTANGWLTNKVIVIRIVARGSNPEEARLAANEAATQLCNIVYQQYGVQPSVIQRADTAVRLFWLYELKLRVSRIFSVDI